ncbi:hypothetical protein FPZ12_032955 [Amycolatopsis acidicola]|uniref:Uncharacterized protein n=1 Tax=Amycolatopsis acidicola TaxID=2596893 RepID=A0A5N0UVM2_9PSEU|nr:hypothetical protein [Amycolatopsis acidicola]KAA9154058.1 hypothetical protein FPZ12_032955 [Amycolatopsis acidicola]
MQGKFARALAVLVAGSVLMLSGAGIASAGGKGTSSTEAAGQQVLQLRDAITKAAYGSDVAGTERSLNQLSPLLGDLAAGQKYQIQSDQQQQAGTANGQSTEASRILADPSQASTARQLPPVPSLPDLPAPLNIVSNLLKNLLTLVTSLLGGLLGSAPALPVPTPTLPSV